MLYAYKGEMEISAWEIRTPVGKYLFLPGPLRPGGPVYFTSFRAALRFIDYHRDVWGELHDAVPKKLPVTIQDLTEIWRREIKRELGREAKSFTVVYIDPREPFGGALDIDSEVVSLIESENQLPLEQQIIEEILR